MVFNILNISVNEYYFDNDNARYFSHSVLIFFFSVILEKKIDFVRFAIIIEK